MKYYFVIISFIALLSGCSSNQAADKKQITKTEYQFATFEKGGVATTIKLPAQLSAYQQISIFPKVNG